MNRRVAWGIALVGTIAAAYLLFRPVDSAPATAADDRGSVPGERAPVALAARPASEPPTSDPSAAATPATPVAADPVAAASRFRFRIRNIATGDPMPGVRVLFPERRDEPNPKVLASDVEGRVEGEGEFPKRRAHLDDPTLATNGRVAPPRTAEGESILWIARVRRIRGQVRFVPVPDRPVAATVRALNTGSDEPDGQSVSDRPGTSHWLLFRGWGSGDRSGAVTVDSTGAFVLAVPDVPGPYVVVEATGYRTAVAEVPVGDVPVVVDLHRAPMLRARLRGNDGAPLAAVEVYVHEYEFHPTPSRMLRAQFQATGGAWGQGARGVDVRRTDRRTTGPDGSFELALLHGGSTSIVLVLPGYQSLRQDLGAVPDDRQVELVVVREGPDRGPRFVRGSVVVGNQDLGLLDVTDAVQIQLADKADEHGRIRSGLLTLGHRYYVGGKNGVFTWNGEADVDLDTLKPFE